MTHFIERWECGHVASQCRCPGPKEERTRPGKCPECVGQVSAMPERVEQPTVDEIQAGTAYITADPVAHKVCNWMIAFGRRDAESRLLAAEARVRELEQIHRDEMDLHDEMEAKLAAERDALVAALGNLGGDGVYYVPQERAFAPGVSGQWPEVIPAPHTPHGRLVKRTLDAQARAILAREET